VLQARSWLPRTEGRVHLEFARRGEVTALASLHQSGAARARFPKPGKYASPEVVLLNTAGGLTGGDRIDVSVTLAAGAEAMVTTAAAEKIYRSSEGATEIGVKLAAGARARIAWLPQPTILFDRSRLHRRTDVEMAGDATFLAAETLIFGRAAMGEDVQRGACRDVWRVRRDGALVFADTFQVEGAIAQLLKRPATLAGARAVAMLLYAAPDAADRLDQVRGLLHAGACTAGASSWNGVLLARVMAPDGQSLHQVIAPVAEALAGRQLPRVWQC
jgi:urease accessory protein